MKIKNHQPIFFCLLLLKILLLPVFWGVQAYAQTPLPDTSAKTGTTFVTLTDYAKYKNGDDWSPAFEKAFADSQTVYVPQGRYPCSQVRLASETTIRGAGDGTVFIPLDYRLFVIEGTIGKEIKIAADIVDFSNTIALQSAGGLAVGDDIMIRGQRNSMIREGTAGLNYSVDWVLGRTRKSNCFYGEMDVIKAVAGATITTERNRIFPDYFKDDSREPKKLGEGFIQRDATTVSKLFMVKNATLQNFAIEGTAKCSMPIKLGYSKDCLVEDITFTTSTESYDKSGKPELSLIYGIYVWNTTVRNFKAQLSPQLLATLEAKEKSYANFSNYNLFKIISSTNSGFENCYANGGTHAFNITRSASAAMGGGIPSVNCFIRNSVAANCIWSGVKVQQGCYNTEVSGNTVTASGQGIITCGRKTTIVNNKVNTNLPHSANYYYTHLSRGGTIGIGLIEGYACDSIVRNNTVSNFYSGIAIVDGYEDKNCFEEGNILIEKNTVTGSLRGFTLYKNPHCASLGRKVLDIKIVDNTFTRTGDSVVKIGSESHDTYGIYLPEKTAGVEIRSNTFRNFGHGVWLDKLVDYININGNLFDNSRIGVTLATTSSKSKGYTIHIKEIGNTFTGTPLHSQGLAQKHITTF